ncbi:MAG TPA: nucleotide exchange factor GrpE [Verrucomicrobiae bacterium]|nr:nucleotide exchange factor GrpE [Verrucomicrobiae bacterium]
MENDENTEQIVEETVAPTEQTDYESLYKRALADQENMRKRFDDERKLLGKFAVGDVVIDLLPVLDNFTRATEHVPADQKESSWATGIMYIRKQLMDVLEQRGVQEVTAKIGEKFDPSLHEAIGTVTDNDKEDDTIAEVKSIGYRLHDRVVRPAQVIVVNHEQK